MNGLALCAGIGGLELGVGLALGEDYRTVCWVERDPYAVAVLQSRMRDGRLHDAPIWDDVSTFDGSPWSGQVDLITAGFPCQPWSKAGRRKGVADERWIWPDIATIIEAVSPRLVFLENVSGLATGGGAEMVEADLVRLGYEVSAVMVEASAAGLPHRRRRLFILGHANRHGRVGTRIHLQSRGQELPWVHSTRPSTDLGRVVGWRVPGFSDSPQAWSAWLERWPQAEPCLRRSTHGPSSGVDRNRIRVLGNAVVPECAALAFQWLSFASGIASERD